MLKFKITPERFAEACNIWEYVMAQDGHVQTCVSILPRFLLNNEGEYVISIKYDEDGDVEKFENKDAAVISTSILNTKRFEKLKIELMEAAKAIVNPPKEGG